MRNQHAFGACETEALGDIRRDGLLAMGSAQVSVTASGLEEYDKIARNVAAQVVSEAHRDTLIPCTPANAKQGDDA